MSRHRRPLLQHFASNKDVSSRTAVHSLHRITQAAARLRERSRDRELRQKVRDSAAAGVAAGAGAAAEADPRSRL